MAQQSKKPSLADPNVSTAEYLMFLGRDYTAQARVAGNPGSSSMDVGAALVPMNSSNLELSARASAGLNSPNKFAVSVGNEMFNLSRRLQDAKVSRGGMTTTDTGGVNFGPVKGYYQQSSQPGNQDLQNKSYGVNAGFGPVKLYANRNTSSQEGVSEENVPYYDTTRFDNEKDNVGFNFRLPVGSEEDGGAFTGGVGRTYETQKGPQQLRQETRPMDRPPNVTRFRGGYEGKLGTGILGVGGSLTDVRGVGTESSLEGSYNVRDPLGFGGELSARGSYNNPIGGESAAQALINYRMKF